MHRDTLLCNQGTAQFCSGEVLYLAVQINGGWTLRFLLGEDSHQLVHELIPIKS